MKKFNAAEMAASFAENTKLENFAAAWDMRTGIARLLRKAYKRGQDDVARVLEDIGPWIPDSAKRER